MNLKEAFRYQNKLQRLLEETESVLENDSNVTVVENTYLRKKVMPEAENETVQEQPESEYADKITELAGFGLFLLAEREKLSAAIRAAKNALPVDMDSEVSLNVARQSLARVYKHMADLRATEVTIPNGGTGFRFNAEGNQVAYRCDVKKVTSIHFDRNEIRKYLTGLNARADAVSAQLDKCLVNSSVAYQPPFDVNDSFAQVFEGWLEGK